MHIDLYFCAQRLELPGLWSHRLFRVSLVFALELQMFAAIFSACGSPSTGHPSKTLTSIRVTPPAPTFRVGSTQQLTAVGTFSDGTESDVSTSVTWSVSDPVLTSIDHSGLVRGMAIGRPQITAASSNVQGSTTLIIVGAATSPVARFAYVTGQNFDPPDFQGTVSTYTIQPSTGQLREISYITTSNVDGPVSIDPSNAFAYVLNGSIDIPPGASMISVFAVDAATGRLTPVAGSPFPTGEPLVSTLIIEPRGQFIYAVCASGKVLAFAINHATGALTPLPGATILTGAFLSLASVDPAGQFLYVATGGSPDFVLWAFKIDHSTGALSLITGSPFAGGGSGMTIDLSGHFLYAVSGDIVFAFAIDPATGALQKLPSDPNAVSRFETSGIALDPDGKFLYIAHDDLDPGPPTDYIAVLKIDSDGGVTQQPRQFPTSRVIPGSLKFDPSGKLLFASEAGSSIESFSVGDSGSLTSLGIVQTPTTTNQNNFTLSAGSTEVVYQPEFAYVADAASNDVRAYTIDPHTGALSFVGMVAATNPSSVVVDTFGRFAYVTQQGNNTVEAYSIDPATGALNATASIAAGSRPIAASVDPSGRFLYVANMDSNNVSMYTINMTTGVLTSIGTVVTGSTPIALAIDPTGQFTFIASQGSSDVSVYSIDVSTGLLTSVGTLDSMNPTLPPSDMSGRSSIAIDVSGRFLYTGGRSGLISMYSSDPTIPFFLPAGKISAGVSPIVVATEPSARFVYAAETGANSIHVFSTNPGNGTLTSDETVATGVSPVSLVVDPSGKFAYVANKNSDDISIFAVDATTGFLTSSGTVRTGNQPVSIVTTATIH